MYWFPQTAEKTERVGGVQVTCILTQQFFVILSRVAFSKGCFYSKLLYIKQYSICIKVVFTNMRFLSPNPFIEAVVQHNEKTTCTTSLFSIRYHYCEQKYVHLLDSILAEKKNTLNVKAKDQLREREAFMVDIPLK